MEGDLGERLARASETDHFRAMVDLTRQLDLERWSATVRASGRDKASRRAAVIGALERVAESQQASLRPLLDRLVRTGSLEYVRPVAIVNRLVIEGKASGILEVARSPEVARILPEWTSRRTGKRGASSLPWQGSDGPFRSWAIASVGADKLWAQGLTGEGVIVASIDTGIFGDHEQFKGRRLEGSRGWYDPVTGSSVPHDSHGHGTSVLSVAVGGNPDGREVGIAPGATWAAALGNWNNHYSRVRMTLAADWILRVARPEVVVNAWSHDEGECSDFDLPFINAWIAAEILPVFPAGNSGPHAGTGEAPACLAGALPDGGAVFSVAALTPQGSVLLKSSRGPSHCGSLEFPSLSAPGSDLPAAALGSAETYRNEKGTSLAAGLVGGAAALLLQFDPELSPAELQRILIQSAADVPPDGRDDASGAGALDLPAALELARAAADARRRKTDGGR